MIEWLGLIPQTIKWAFRWARWTIARSGRYRQTARFLQLSERHSLRYYSGHAGEMMVFPIKVGRAWLPLWKREVVLPQVLILNNTSGDVPRMRFESGSQFELAPRIVDLTSKAFAAYTKYVQNFPHLMNFDGLNARLSDITTSGNETILHLQDVSYRDYIRTNLCLDFRVSGKQTLRSIVHPAGKLDKLKDTPLANNLGINCLLFTRAGKMVLQRRTWDVIVRPGELAPTFSGTVILDDIGADGLMHPRMIYREGREELGEKVFHGQVPHFLGATRELVRGGHPELFFCSIVDLTEDEIIEAWRTARDKREVKRVEFYQLQSTHPPDPQNMTTGRLEQTRNDIERLMRGKGRAISLPLKTNIALWYAWLERKRGTLDKTPAEIR